MDILTIDFETYYDKDYSLSKLTIAQYIRSPLFEIIGVSVKVNHYPADWYSGTNPGKYLKKLNYDRRAILCHNTAFDGAILSWLFDIRPKLWLDTLSMARPIHGITVGKGLAKLAIHHKLGRKGTEVVSALGKHRDDFTRAELAQYGSYCINDVNLTKALFDKLKAGFPINELLIIDQTLRMYTEPVLELDATLLKKHLVEIRANKQALLNGLDRETFMSNNKFAEYLSSLGVEPPTKLSLTTGKETWAFAKTDEALTALLDHEDERVQAAVATRLGVRSTLEESRTEALIEAEKHGCLPILLNYYGAHTGRFSGGDKLNLQNLPVRGNSTIRRALKAPEGHVLISCDLSQIEARILAWVARQDDLLNAFRQRRDIYSEFASEIYGRQITKEDVKERFVGKVSILGLGYGMGPEKFQHTLAIGQAGISVKIDCNEAEHIVRLYRQKILMIVQFWRKCDNALKDMLYGGHNELHSQIHYNDKGIRLPNGFYIQYPALRETANGFMYISNAAAYRKLSTPDDISWTKLYGSKVTENIVQALAALVIREQMVVAGQRYKTVLQIHDEIIICVPENTALDAQTDLESLMSIPPKWAPDLPIACESSVAANYGDM